MQLVHIYVLNVIFFALLAVTHEKIDPKAQHTKIVHWIIHSENQLT